MGELMIRGAQTQRIYLNGVSMWPNAEAADSLWPGGVRSTTSSRRPISTRRRSSLP